jgi:hypothetical protein
VNLIACDIEQRQDHLGLAVDLVDAPIVVAVVYPRIVHIRAAMLGRRIDDMSVSVLAHPRDTFEAIAGVQSCEPASGTKCPLRFSLCQVTA